jgi:hypothetical protein
VLAVIRCGLDATEHTFYLKPSGDGFLMDWDATRGLWPIPFNTSKRLPNNWLAVARSFMMPQCPSEYENKRLLPRGLSIRRSP